MDPFDSHYGLQTASEARSDFRFEISDLNYLCAYCLQSWLPCFGPVYLPRGCAGYISNPFVFFVDPYNNRTGYSTTCSAFLPCQYYLSSEAMPTHNHQSGGCGCSFGNANAHVYYPHSSNAKIHIIFQSSRYVVFQLLVDQLNNS